MYSIIGAFWSPLWSALVTPRFKLWSAQIPSLEGYLLVLEIWIVKELWDNGLLHAPCQLCLNCMYCHLNQPLVVFSLNLIHSNWILSTHFGETLETFVKGVNLVKPTVLSSWEGIRVISIQYPLWWTGVQSVSRPGVGIYHKVAQPHLASRGWHGSCYIPIIYINHNIYHKQ